MATCSGVYSENEMCKKCKNKVTCILVANTESKMLTRVRLLDEKLLLIMQALSSLIDKVESYNNQNVAEIVEVTKVPVEDVIEENNRSLVAAVKAKIKGVKNEA